MGNFLFSPLIHKNNWDIQFVKHRFDVNTSTFPQRLLPNQMLGQLRGDWRAKKYIWLLLRSIYIRKKGSTSTVTLTLRVFIFALLSYSSRCRNRWSGFKWSDKNSLFKMGIRENLKLCAITWSVTFKYSVSYDDICTYSKVQIVMVPFEYDASRNPHYFQRICSSNKLHVTAINDRFLRP